jgi:alcohol dehydrogenase
VLVHSAAGGVGCFALAICKILGAYPIATIGSATKKDFLKARYGLREGQVLVRETDRRKFAEQLKGALREKRRVEGGKEEEEDEEEGEVEGFDLILDALGGMYFKEGYKQMARGGRMITFGAADYLSKKDTADWLKIIPRYLTRPSLDPGDMCGENKGVLGFNLIW